jgi:hypothetical protein
MRCFSSSEYSFDTGSSARQAPQLFADLLLGPADAVAVFDDVGASALASFVSRLDHDLNGPIDSKKPECSRSTASITTGEPAIQCATLNETTDHAKYPSAHHCRESGYFREDSKD